MKRVGVRMFSNPLAIRVGVLVFAAGMLALVVISPIALRQIARIPGVNWGRLSNIGQTYGAVSALLTTLALGGVIISLLYQARDVKTTQEQASRTFHHELLKMEMEDPLYMEALAPWGRNLPLADYDSLRQFNFVHMWVSYWEGLYMLREMSELSLRSAAAIELFNGVVGRQYWVSSRPHRMNLAKGRNLRFAKIIDEEYNKAISSGPPVTVSLRSNSEKATSNFSQKMTHAESGIVVCVAVAGGIMLGRLVGRWPSRRSL